MKRKLTRVVNIKDLKIGGNNPVIIQSMTNTDTRDVKSTLEQINKLVSAGCQMVRCAVPDMEACEALKEITEKSPVPIVADIHFDYRLALKAIENGVSKLRINPGNIGDYERIRAVVSKAKENGIPIRIGVNSGSLEKDILQRDGKPTAKGLVESALRHVKILEDLNFYDIVVSIKSSNVPMMIESYRLMSDKCNYPLHLGVTESGTTFKGTIKSSIGIGTLLAEGIGSTIRVSLTSDPIEEIKVAKEILRDLEYTKEGIELISCPTCGRTEINLIGIAEEVERRLEGINKNIKIAVMGCVVNGPGEAREADIGIAGGKGVGIIFKKGEIVKKVKEENLVDELINEIKSL
ncbi:flavodoxin-dependent (E)-4-hydroxy-3-methylbut-2-enyl-diphosphate synthase [Clostridium sp.]|uniref:flavodoxin-dependent (E)-4-hydroxy-3-methylbut-2-enyl-diphosphate synthase n=1 Tax=Clostridium sp. TaxID=1506 RepID=UPI0026DA8CC6|nr:flavodoxin-dependent (E)-4-hydroxy-3-methylbut-2-enyl-diphosphate synthase [Clostridium sp.]MDO5038206.1 flavodoxin-dependent (E)-4-hydroxy-3-methylbut-2-enyl-diphosphate synthase [Clostridium sp.]